MLACLIIDESDVVRQVARRILEGFDFSVREAQDGAVALDICQSDMPDFILLDWQPPVLDSMEFLVRLRKLDGGDRPRVVYCTSEVNVARIAKVLRAGADEYLLKPFDRGQVEDKLHDVGILRRQAAGGM